MRLVIGFLAIVLFSSATLAQKKKRPRAIHWYNWTDSVAFQNGPIPLVQSYGYFSDSLSKVHGGIFYTLGDEYFPIKTTADYYLWFTRRYEFLFRDKIETYELFYIAGDQLSMATFISTNYKGKRFPIRLSLSTPSNLKYIDPKKEKLAKRKEQRAYDKNVSDPVKLSRPVKNE